MGLNSMKKELRYHLLNMGVFRHLLHKAGISPHPFSQEDNAIDEIHGQLNDLSSALNTECKNVESDFIQIGSRLQDIYGDVRQLTEKVRQSAGLIGGENREGMLFQIQGVAKTSQTALEKRRKDIADNTLKILAIIDRLDSLTAVFPSVNNIGRHLRIIAVSIAIESVRSTQTEALFAVLADEIVRLSEEMGIISDDSLNVLKTAHDAETALHREIAERLSGIDRMGETAKKIVADAVDQIEGLMASTLEITELAGGSAKEISQQVGKIVMAVQFHDSMSQRVAHITEALEDAKAQINQDDSEQMRHVFSNINLQSAQLKDVVAEIGLIHETARQSLKNIVRELDGLTSQLLELSAGAEPAKDRQLCVDSFDHLQSSFSELNSVLQEGYTLMDSVRNAASSASDTVKQVSGLVKDIHNIGFSTHLMALNAIIKAAHLGEEGGMLEVLAQEVSQCSDRSTAIMTDADNLLNRITSASDHLDDQPFGDGTEVSLDDSMVQITRTYREFTEAAAEAGTQAESIRQAISETMEALAFLPRLAERFSRSLAQLEAMARNLAVFSPENHRMSQTEVDDYLQRYTMEKERAIHAAAFVEKAGGKQSSPSRNLPRFGNGPEIPWAASDDTDPMQPVELFIDSSHPSKTTDAVEQLPEGAEPFADNVELFDMDAASPATTDSPDGESGNGLSDEETEDFGDNVELF